MYKILIADDEKSIRYGLSHAIPWGELGFEVAGAVSDGSEILEFVEDNPIDVLLTDIKMHKIDGLTVAKELSKKLPSVKIVILSGYSEVDYLQEAIRSKVAAYLNKPTDRDELQNEFKKLKKVLDDERNIKSEQEQLRAYLKESLPYMREIMFFKLLFDDSLTNESNQAIENKMGFYDIQIPHSGFSVVIITIDNKYRVGKSVSPEKWYLIFQTAIYLACGIFKSQNFFYDRNGDVIVGICENENIIEKIEALQGKFSDIEKGLTLSAAISAPSRSVSEFSGKYGEAARAIKQKVFFGDEAIILFEEVAQLFSDSVPDVGYEAEQIIDAVFNKDEASVLREVSGLFAKLNDDGNLFLEYADRICLEILFEVEKVFGLSDSNFSKFMQEQKKNIFDIIKFDNTADKKKWLLDTLIDFARFNSTEIHRKISKAVRDGMMYINNNYSDNNISLNSVADFLDKNPTYFSHVFKSETGKTFSEYVRDLRIEKAKQLLLESNMKIYEISQKVGYIDVTTLTRIFKKVMGVNPNEYRSRSVGENG